MMASNAELWVVNMHVWSIDSDSELPDVNVCLAKLRDMNAPEEGIAEDIARLMVSNAELRDMNASLVEFFRKMTSWLRLNVLNNGRLRAWLGGSNAELRDVNAWLAEFWNMNAPEKGISAWDIERLTKLLRGCADRNAMLLVIMDLLEKACLEFKDGFTTMDGDMSPFILTLLVDIYVVGDKKEQSIPSTVFKPETINEIERLRNIAKQSPEKEAAYRSVLDKMQESTLKERKKDREGKPLELFDEIKGDFKENSGEMEALNQLIKIAYREIRSSSFLEIFKEVTKQITKDLRESTSENL